MGKIERFKRLPYAKGAIRSVKTLRKYERFYLAIPHCGEVHRAYWITEKDFRLEEGYSRWDMYEANVSERNEQNNCFCFTNYFLAWAYVQRYITQEKQNAA